jgi:hypothetical protein
MIVRLLAWWRRRHVRPLDWADPESPIYCPELVKPGGYVRHVSSYPPRRIVVTNAETDDRSSAVIVAGWRR